MPLLSLPRKLVLEISKSQQIFNVKSAKSDFKIHILNLDYQFFSRGNIAILRFKKYKGIYLPNAAYEIALQTARIIAYQPYFVIFQATKM
jgi:hypothetical protein